MEWIKVTILEIPWDWLKIAVYFAHIFSLQCLAYTIRFTVSWRVNLELQQAVRSGWLIDPSRLKKLTLCMTVVLLTAYGTCLSFQRLRVSLVVECASWSQDLLLCSLRSWTSSKSAFVVQLWKLMVLLKQLEAHASWITRIWYQVTSVVPYRAWNFAWRICQRCLTCQQTSHTQEEKFAWKDQQFSKVTTSVQIRLPRHLIQKVGSSLVMWRNSTQMVVLRSSTGPRIYSSCLKVNTLPQKKLSRSCASHRRLLSA